MPNVSARSVSALSEDAAAAGPTMDGRAQRSVRTRRLVVEAFLDLVDAGEAQPTAQQVSDRSGASMRSIFRLFEDVEAMHTAAIAAQLERVAHLIVPPPSKGPAKQRVKAIVDGRSKLFEAISPVRRLAVRLAPASVLIGADLDLANAYFRDQLGELFAPELRALTPSRRANLHDGLDVATSWETWERLRQTQGLSERRARQVVTEVLEALLLKAGR